MIKYSLVAVATVAVLFSVGCDDSACCGTGQAVANPTTNAPRAVIKADGFTAQQLQDCTAGADITFNGLDSIDNEDGKNLDTSKYVWKVNGTKVASSTVKCPSPGETKEVCLTVEDSDKKVSTNMACMTLGKKAVASSCPPLTITVKENNTTVTELKTGHTYKFTYANACPNATCKWTFVSYKNKGATTGEGRKDCIADKHVSKADGTNLTAADTVAPEAIVGINICAKQYAQKTLDVQINCTGGKMGDRSSTLKTYTFVEDK